MAKIPKISQSIFGQGRAAQVNTRPVAVPSSLSGAGDLVNTSADLFKQVSDGAMALARGGQQLALEEAQVAFNDAITKRFESEIYSLSGEAAAGSAEVANRILREEESRQLEKLSRYGVGASRTFRMYAAKSATDRLAGAVRYGRGQVTRARVEAGNKEMAQSADVYAKTGSDTSYKNVLTVFARTYTTSGQRIVTENDIASFDKNAADGFVVARGGEKWRIVDSIKEGDSGVITRDKVAGTRAQLEAERQAYEKARQNQIDMLVAKRLDQFLERGQLDQAQTYLENTLIAGEIDSDYHISDNARSLMETRLEVFSRNKLSADEALTLVQTVVASGAKDPMAVGGKYLTAEMERAAAETISMLTERATTDTTGMAKRTLDLFKANWAARKSQMKENLDADTALVVGKMRDNGLFNKGNLAARGQFISNLPEGPIKRKLTWKWAEEKAAEEAVLEKRNPSLLADRKARINGIKVCIASGRIKGPDGKYFDVSDNSSFFKYINSNGFTDAERADLKAYRDNPRIEVALAADAAADALDSIFGFKDDAAKGRKYFDATNVWRIYPDLEAEIQRITRFRPDIDFRKPKKEDVAWLRTRIVDYIKSQEYIDPASGRALRLVDMLENAVTKEGDVVYGQEVTPDRLYELVKTPEQIRREFELVRSLLSASLGPDADTNQPYHNIYDGERYASHLGLAPVNSKKGKWWAHKHRAEKLQKEEDKKVEQRRRSLDGELESISLLRMPGVELIPAEAGGR